MDKLSSFSVETTVYQLAGLRLVSELPLSGLVVSDDAAAGDVLSIRRASIPLKLSSASRVHDDAQCDDESLLFAVPGVARYLIRQGREILVDAEPTADKNDVRAYLLGLAFGTLCHQRGILPLHSSAIDLYDGCVAFIGPSGAGKSTLAAALAARQHQVIADDVSFLRSNGKGSLMTWPGIGRIRLWEDAIAALGYNGPGIEREYRGYNKYLIPVRPPADPFMPRRLRAIYHLAVTPVGTAPSISQMQAASAVEILLQNIYCDSYAEYMGHQPAIFRFCATIASEVPVFRFSRAMSFATLHEGVECLENHMRNVC